jgi:hypothetical protein
LRWRRCAIVGRLSGKNSNRLALPSLAHAYADPGAGSLLLQLLVGGAAGLFVAFRLFRDKILRLFGVRKTDDNQ